MNDLMISEEQVRAVPMAVVACEVMRDELQPVIDDAEHIIDVRWIEQGLHDDPDKLRQTLAEQIAQIEADHPQVQHIALGYGLCSRGIEGLKCERCTMVAVRAHDCIALLLGSRQAYNAYITENPGTYWYSPGWNRCHVPPGPQRYQQKYDAYRQQYGEDNAEFLMEQEQAWFQHYSRATYISPEDQQHEADVQYSQQCADWLGWQFDHVQGKSTLFRRLICGPWQPEDVLVIPPGRTLTVAADDRVIKLNTPNT